jgi:hypothetical protein
MGISAEIVMAARHRIPTIFNLSMVDVLCCALGCVILLWLLNLRDAKQRAETAGQTFQLLTDTRALLRASEQQAADLDAKVVQTLSERDLQRQRAEDAEKAAAALQQQLDSIEDQLARKTKEQQDTSKELATARQGMAALGQLVREKEDQANVAVQNIEALEKRVKDTDARLVQATTQANLVPGLREEARMTREKLAAADVTAADLRKELDARKQDLAGAGRTVGTLEENTRRLEGEVAALREEKKSLVDQAVRARAAAENRFAGIDLTGRKVIFLVDMSGSMELTDENTAAPDKWNEVRQTLAKIMRSMTEITHFQVILFSNQVQFPMGGEGRWLEFDPKTSPARVLDALGQIKPRGNTDMYSAFQTAFRYRADGLDTIYLLSDGLPNMGPGLSPEAARTMKETERGDALGKHVRRTLLSDWNRAIPGKPRVRINGVGFFYESPDVGAFLWALTRENDGSFVGMNKP